jgi:(p)ppGpp synthase/HD superfamily hydrolase
MEKTNYTKLRTKVFGIIEGLTLIDSKYFDVRRAITFAEEVHCNERKDGNPEFSHQLEMLSLALSMHSSLINPYGVYMAIIVHDTIEDYPEVQGDLYEMFPEAAKYSRMLAKFIDPVKDTKTYHLYFEQLASCDVCSVVKLIDRVHNLSTAPGVFTNRKLGEYCDEAETYFLTMMKDAKNNFNQREVYEVLKFMLTTQVRTIRKFLVMLETPSEAS